MAGPTAPLGGDHIVAGVRAELAGGPPHLLAVRVTVDGDAVVLSGPVETENARRLALETVTAVLLHHGVELRLVDDLHVPELDPRPPEVVG